MQCFSLNIRTQANVLAADPLSGRPGWSIEAGDRSRCGSSMWTFRSRKATELGQLVTVGFTVFQSIYNIVVSIFFSISPI